MADFSEYRFFGGPVLELEKTQKLHEKIVELKGRFFEDRVMQNLLLNKGYELEEDKRPKSFFDVGSSVWNRRKACLHLVYLSHMIDLASKPQIIMREPKILLPGEGEPRFVTPQGYDAERVEELQAVWLTDGELVGIVNQYQGTLQRAFDEYNSQCMVGLVERCLHCFIDLGWPERKLQEQIAGLIDGKSYSALDNAYYTMASRFFAAAGPLWQQLSGSELGKMFVLTAKEINQGLKMVFMRR